MSSSFKSCYFIVLLFKGCSFIQLANHDKWIVSDSSIYSTYMDCHTCALIMEGSSMAYSDNTCPQCGRDTSHLTDLSINHFAWPLCQIFYLNCCLLFVNVCRVVLHSHMVSVKQNLRLVLLIIIKIFIGVVRRKINLLTWFVLLTQ